MRQLRRFFVPEGDEGQAVVFVALVLLGMLFAVGLAIDAGTLYSAKRSEQEAADAAAFAGAVVLYQGGSASQAKAAARDDAATNGYVHLSNQTTVLVNMPPQSGPYLNDTDHVEVIITRQVRTALVPAQAGLTAVTARGVAGTEGLQSGYAIMALDRGNTDGSFNVSSNGDIHVTGGGILVNSSSSSAATSDQNSNARFNITPNDRSIDIRGHQSGTWPSDVNLQPGHIQIPDPFAGTPAPRPADLDLPICDSLLACQDGAGNQIPGVYTVSIADAGNANIRLNTGVYVLTHGMNLAGNAGITSNPGGVLLFNTYSNFPGAPGPTPTCSDVNLSGNGSVNIAAMTTPPWANLLFYQDRLCTTLLKIAGNGGFYGTGSVYVPSGKVQFDGNPSTLNGSQLIAKNVDVQNGNITINYNAATTAQPRLPRLAE